MEDHACRGSALHSTAEPEERAQGCFEMDERPTPRREGLCVGMEWQLLVTVYTRRSRIVGSPQL